MRSPRFRVASVMALVAGLALDLAAIRAWLAFRTDGRIVSNTIDVLGLGCLPMANVLAIGLVGWRTRPAWRPFLVGFVGAGAVAFALYIALACSSTESLVMPLLYPILWPLSRALARVEPVVGHIANFLIAAIVLGSPQFILAVIGGLLTRKLGVASGALVGVAAFHEAAEVKPPE